MPVFQPKKDYTEKLPYWQVVRDCCAGEQAIKNARAVMAESSNADSLSMAGSYYLPVPNSSDTSPENQARYRDYKKRAVFTNYTGHTKEALLGMVFRKKPKIDLAPQLKGMLDDADGAGNSLESLMKRTTDEVLQVARQGLLLDYPAVSEPVAPDSGILPMIKSYCAESVINWRTDVIDGRQRLCLVVLKESREIWVDEFTSESEECYRVLTLTDEGVYVQFMYDKNGALIVDEVGNSMIVPKQADGNPWLFIPFIFVGAINNDPEVDTSPLYDLAVVNLAHYRNSADYEESCFLVGQPTVALSGLTQNWVDEVLKGSVMIGSRAAIPLPVGGSAVMLQSSPNQMPLEAMRHKEQQMIQIGAKIITDTTGVETAEAARIRFAGQNSKLGTLIGNVEQAYNQLLNWALFFTGGGGSSLIELNKEFYDKKADPQMIMAQIQLLDRGVIAVQDVRGALRNDGAISPDRTDDDIDNDIADSDPTL